MFERKKYKEFAKQQLKNRWGIPILITLIVTVISGLLSIKNFVNPDLFMQYFSNSITYEEFVEGYVSVDTPLSFMIDFLQTLISGILSVACANVYLKMSRSPEKITFSTFIQGLNLWSKAVLATLWTFLWTSLWSLQIIIP